ncbi:MAG: lactate utilization protein C [Candidatus Dormibacteria bacterium]
MSDRAAFLSRLREAVAVAVPPPRHPVVATGSDPPPVDYAIPTDGVEAFSSALAALGGTTHRAADRRAAREVVLGLVAGRAPLLVGAEADVAALRLEGLQWPGCGIAGAARAAVGVVGCRALVAATGSVVVDAAAAAGRSLSLLPPACIVVARAAQLVATPGDVLRRRDRLWPGGVPSQVVLITGPSRSADIEMTLTRGVHGPGEFAVVVIDG